MRADHFVSVRRGWVGLFALTIVGVASPRVVLGAPAVTVAVDATAGNHAISPLIYGMNFATAAQASAARIPLTRWGGNSTSRYNYQIDTSNTGSDYYFENIPGCWGTADNYCSTVPKDPMTNSGANAFLAGAGGSGMTALLTIPTIGWVAKVAMYAHPFDCGCPKTALPNQDSFDPYDTNCGNGQLNGNWLACPAATTTSITADPTWTTAWVTYLTQRLGPANGTRIYALDNEPNLWSSTHHDVHPTALTYDELWQRMHDNAVAIVTADPTAQVSGPVEWGWPNYLCSDADDISKGCSAQSPDRAAHGGEELVAWLLDQAHAYDMQNNKRLLHYLDLHYYPQGGNAPDNLRSLWDPTYTDPSWINTQIELIPRMHAWVDQHYPGTKIMVSEYDWGNHNTAAGAVTYAEILGIFGREGLDAATAWSPPAQTDAAFAAYVLYANYDGQGAHFERENAQVTVTGSNANAFAAFGPSGMTVVLTNESAAAQMVTVNLTGFTPSGMAHWYVNSGATVTRSPDIAPNGNSLSLMVAPTSFGLLVIPGTGPSLGDMGAPLDDMTMVTAASDMATNQMVFDDGVPTDDMPAHTGDLSMKSTGQTDAATGASTNNGCGCRVAGGSPAGAPLGTSLCALAIVLFLARRRLRVTIARC